MGITHITVDFCLWDECCNGVHNNDIYCARAHHHLSDLKSLFSSIWLGDIQVVDIHTDIPGVDRIKKLIRNKTSEKENRLGTVLALLLPKGQISYDDYRKYGTKYKWNNDMELAMRLGLVETHDQKQYTIVKHLISDPPSLNNHQKEVVTKMYNCFGDERFSTEMVIATLDYSGTSASACLRQLTMLRILDYNKEDENQYRFLVNPLENPQLFEQVS